MPCIKLSITYTEYVTWLEAMDLIPYNVINSLEVAGRLGYRLNIWVYDLQMNHREAAKFIWV